MIGEGHNRMVLEAFMFQYDVGVIGGCGHIGLPLSLLLADCGLKTVIYDIDTRAVAGIRDRKMPFREENAQEILDRVIPSGMLMPHDTPEKLSQCKFLVLIVGTPVDEHLNPGFRAIHNAIDGCQQHLRNGQILILRSTVFPGMSERIQRYVREKGLDIAVTFCPERVAQGYSLREFRELPQIISGFDPKAVAEVRALFERFASEIIEVLPMEAELAKLMTNSWRYIQFAVTNQFYMIAKECGADYDRILHACRHKYPRMAGMPGPGFAAGPCLVKDTMQLAAFSHNTFVLGHAALLINEGLPYFLVKLAKERMNLKNATAGILGMAFKAESDDPRDSLSYKLKKLLMLEAQNVLCTDPYVRSSDLVPLETVLEKADVVFVGTPHRAYRQLKMPQGKVVIDVWNCTQ